MNTVVIYARYSTEHQTEASIKDQLRRCKEYAADRKWTVTAEFTDEGISGAAVGNRPGVLAALEALKRGYVLLIADTTRLSRSQDLAPLLARLRHRGVRVIGVLDGFDSDSPTARMQAGLSGIMSEEFRSQIAARTHSALDMRARLGKSTGGKCYGFTADGQIDESQAVIVREVFSRAAALEPLVGIAADLNARHIPSPGADWSRKSRRSDGLWMKTAIHSMLGNERYIGKVVWNRSGWHRDPDTGKRIAVARPESEWVVTSGPAIVDIATWEQVRAATNPRRSFGGGPGGGPKYLLSGILTCGVCGRKLVSTGENAGWYYCGTYKAGGVAACSMSVGTRRDVAEELILAPVRESLQSPEAVEIAVSMIEEWSREERLQDAQPAEVCQIDARIARIEAQIDAGTLDRADMAPSLAALHEKRQRLLAHAWRKASGHPRVDKASAIRAYRSSVERLSEVLKGGAVAPARAALQKVLGDVLCTPQERHLVALVKLDPVPLMKAAGIELGQSGSGGRI
jgi:site-specific DNA recombinase